MYNLSELDQYSLTLPEPYTEQVQIMSIHSKRAKEIIQTLSQTLPLQKFNLGHLKRAKKLPCPTHLSIIIAPTEEIDDFSEYDSMSDECDSCKRYSKVLVPNIPPYTKSQLSTWSKLWPCYLIQPSIPPYIHTSDQIQEIEPILSQIKPNSSILFAPSKNYVIESGDGLDDWQHSTLMAIDKFKVERDEYLCTNALAILYEEPCVMCAMALVHSRIQRLYFCYKTPNGAFTYHKLHERSLNYMYKIFMFNK